MQLLLDRIVLLLARQTVLLLLLLDMLRFYVLPLRWRVLPISNVVRSVVMLLGIAVLYCVWGLLGAAHQPRRRLVDVATDDRELRHDLRRLLLHLRMHISHQSTTGNARCSREPWPPGQQPLHQLCIPNIPSTRQLLKEPGRHG